MVATVCRLAIPAAVLAAAAATAAAQAPVARDSVTAPLAAIDHAAKSTVAFYVPEKDLLPESIAYDAKDGAFYVGSTRKGKVVRVARDGSARDFIAPRQDGLWMVIGIKIHATRRVLWVCSFDGGNLEGWKESDRGASGVFAFNLDTGRLIRKWVLDAPGEVHAFNDLVLTRGNDAYVTHMFDGGAVYRIGDDDGRLAVLPGTTDLQDPNGIALSPDERTLFVADARGIAAIERETGKTRMLQAADDESLGGVDGLYFHRGSLIAVHTTSVRRHRLDAAMARVVSTEILEANHPLFDVPTTGVIVGTDFFLVANAQFGAVQADGSLLPTDRLNEPAILKIPLQ